VASDLYYRVSITAGSASYDLSPDLSSFSIEEDEAKPDQLTVQVSDPFKVLSHAIQEGMEVEVDLGTVDDHSVVFRGRIYKTEGDFPQQGVPTLKLIAYDKSQQMGLRKRNRRWTDMPLSQIVTEVGGEYFDHHVETNLRGDPSFNGNGIRQQDETDLAFLLRLASTYGCEMFVIAGEDDDTLHFESQHSIMSADPEITLYYGRCGVPNRLISFQASGDVSDIQLPRVFAGIDYETGELAEVTTASVEEVGTTEDPFLDENLTEFRERYPERADQLEGLLSAAGEIQDGLREELGSKEREATPGFSTQEDLDVRAENQFSTSLHGMRGSGTASGNHRLRAQTNVGIADVGGRFSGTWYLSQVRHILNNQGYTIELECQR
jgi:phage protein D